MAARLSVPGRGRARVVHRWAMGHGGTLERESGAMGREH